VIGRRFALQAASAIALEVACYRDASAEQDTQEAALIRAIAGGAAALSPRVHVDIPAVFGNGYSVPMTLRVESPMTEADHVQTIHVLAPLNPIVQVARFTFTPQSGRVEISTRIRLAKPQNVLAVALMSDGTRLLGRRFVTVQTDGCS